MGPGTGQDRPAGPAKAPVSYINGDTGSPVDPETLVRIKKLRIPPAWINVKVSRDPNAYLQVTGTDAKQRTQYIYHPFFIQLTTMKKFDVLKEFCKRLHLLFNRISNIKRDLSDKEYVICLMFRILNKTYLRIGNYGYDTYGLTTLEHRHVSFPETGTVKFDFIGKKSVRQQVTLKDPMIYRDLIELCTANKRCSKIFSVPAGPTGPSGAIKPGTGPIKVPVTSSDMNAYIKECMGPQFSCKDFRTYASNKIFIELLCSGTELKKAREIVANALGHTKTVSKKSYLMYKIEETYLRDNTVFNKRLNPVKFLISIL